MNLSIRVSLQLLTKNVKPIALLFAVCCLLFNVKGQNLVNNGGFEDITNCNIGSADIDSAIGWWGSLSPDLFNSCSLSPDYSVPSNVHGSQLAFEGDGYAFFGSYAEPLGSNFREYVQTKLSDSLLSEAKYYLSLKVSFTENLQHTSDGIGAFLSMDTVYGVGLGQIIDSLPQVQVPDGIPIIDKTNWVQIDGCFIAKGGESFLTIGNFKHDHDLTIQSLGGNSIFGGYYLDDVQLHKIPSFKSDSNHFICDGIVDRTFLDLSDTSELTTYSWSPTNGLTSPASPQTWAKPSVTTTYTLSQYTPCDTSSRQVTVYVDCDSVESVESVKPLTFPPSNFTLFPNPNKGEFSFAYKISKKGQLFIYSSIGQKIAVFEMQPENTTLRIVKNELRNGIYMYKISIEGETVHTGKFAIVK
jgi:hypothetical protein